ncbi:MAG: OmpA family protein [Saprospiraceae bacterium]|nr:OmpA family protein [Saprospiraceae bacterium]
MKKAILFISSILVLGSCVPHKQHAEIKQENERLTKMLGLSDSLIGGNLDIDERTSVQNDYSSLLLANERLRSTNKNLNQSYQELLERYTRLIEQNKGMMDNTNSSSLSSQNNDSRLMYLQNLDNQINQRKQQLQSLERNFSQELNSRDRQIVQLQNELFRRDQELQQMRNALSNVQANFPATDLDITEKNGQLYVSLSQELLFRSGSARLDRNGRSAIGQIAQALANLPYIRIMVEGHTDNQGDPAQNWELSLDRALAVARELQQQGVGPDQLVVAGRGEYAPKSTNTTENGRALNRRTDIILSPHTEIGAQN